MKKYILLVLILCSYLVSCDKKGEIYGLTPRFYGFYYVILDAEGNNILAKDVVDLDALTVECEGYVFDVQPMGRAYISIPSEEIDYGIVADVYSDILWSGETSMARFSWSASWGEEKTVTIKYRDCEWNVVGRGDEDDHKRKHAGQCEVWIDGVESELVYVGKQLNGDESWAYELRMK